MQCPNCGKEAINVNGKHVCLDCGVEIDRGDPVASPTVSNHDPVDLGSTDPAPAVIADTAPAGSVPPLEATPENTFEGTTEEKLEATEKVIEPEDQTSQGKGPVEDYYLNTLSESNNPAKEGEAKVPDFPVSPEISATIDVASETPAAAPAPAASADEPTNQTPVFPPADPIGGSSPSSFSQANQTPTPVNDQPEAQNDIPEPAVAPVPNPATDVNNLFSGNTPADVSPVTHVDTNQTEVTPAAPVDSPISLPVTVPTEEEVSADTAPAPAGTPADQNYFQPESFDLKKQEDNNATFEAFSTPAGFGSGEPMVEDLGAGSEKNPQDNVAASEQASTVPTPNSGGAGSGSESGGYSLDELLQKYSNTESPANQAPTTIVPAPTEPTAAGDPTFPTSSEVTPNPAVPEPEPALNPAFTGITPSVDSVQAAFSPPSPASTNDLLNEEEKPVAMPNTGVMPSAESVFGPEVATAQAPKKNKLWLILIAAAVGVLVIGGLVFLAFSLAKPRQTKQELSQEAMFKISDQVSKAMDQAQNVSVAFDQNLDFSTATLTTADPENAKTIEALKQLFTKPVSAKGTWQEDNNGSIALSGTYADTDVNNRYFGLEKVTYTKGATGWTKTDGFGITGIPPFFSAQNKGSLFYLTRVNNITDLGGETVGGEVWRKIRISSKPEVFQDLLSGASASLAKTKYQSVTSDNVEVLAWLNKENKIMKVTVEGDLGIDSDLYQGTVHLSIKAEYTYKDVRIEKPV